MRLASSNSDAIYTIAAIFCLVGCVSPVYNYSPRRIEISEPPLGTVNTAFVGDNLLRQGSYIEHEAILLFEDTIVGTLGSYRLRRGWYLKQGERGNSEFYLPSPQDGGAIVPAPLSDPPQVVLAYKDEPKICVVTAFNASVCKRPASFERRRQPVTSSDSFQQTLIYSGRVGDKINIGYREFSNNLARPAFNNDVEYDLSDSRVIGYKGARLEVIEATNESITYKVLQEFR